jgi:UDP-N-acetylglucosamine--N-acetylmuramyl-(pentapeptide) pyrophosphoryl-undecaprenol N-acetylglucosamine transferase
MIAIACGGTGGHLFPGVAVGEQLVQRGCAVTLVISPKDVDQRAVNAISGMASLTLPAIGLTRGSEFAFLRAFINSYRTAQNAFVRRPWQAALAMGGFTSAPIILAARRHGAKPFLHESNTIPGRANRWLSYLVDSVFVGFPSAAARLRNRDVTVTGTPVRKQFRPADAAICRSALGLDPARPVVVVLGGSQGASAINSLVRDALPVVTKLVPEAQWIHSTGSNDEQQIRQAYSASNVKASVQPFFSAMELVLSSATVAISRAGASSLAELAAMRVPSILVPYPSATDDHQFHNADAYAQSGAARLLEQSKAIPESFAQLVAEMLQDADGRAKMQLALDRWNAPAAAERVAEAVLKTINGWSRVRQSSAMATRSNGFAPGTDSPGRGSQTEAPGSRTLSTPGVSPVPEAST